MYTVSHSLGHGQTKISIHGISSLFPVLSALSLQILRRPVFFYNPIPVYFPVTVTQKIEAFSFSSHFLNLLCINKKTVRNALQ